MTDYNKTQYNDIADGYDVLDRLPWRETEAYSFRTAIGSSLTADMNVVELACGSGFYSQKIIEWGCKSVTGCDISEAMVDGAKKRLASAVEEGKARFIVGDATNPTSLAPDGTPGYFDIALGVWLLNYAESKEQLVKMFETAAFNLKDNGVFCTVALHPTNNLDARAAVHEKSPLTKVMPRHTYLERLASGEGWMFEVTLPGNTTFKTFHLTKDIYEEAARLGGFKGKLEWRPEIWKDEELKERYADWMTEADWDVRREHPHMSVLVVHKS